MSGPHLVSVIVIFLNEERFLQAAIDSVVAQTSSNWELLLVNDGSTDRSAAIARNSAKLDPGRIRYLEHEHGQNRGKSVSRNLGLQQAQGDYVTFLDGDDVFLPEKLERQSVLLASREAAMVCGRTLYWHQWPGAPLKSPKDQIGALPAAPNSLIQAPALLTVFLRRPGTVPCICGILVKRSVALEVGGFDESIQDLYEDQIFLAKICAQFPVFVEDGCGERYRQHPNSTSQLAIASGAYHPTRAHSSRLTFLIWLEQFLQSQSVQNPALHRALQRAFFPWRYPRLYKSIDRIRSLPRRVTRKLVKIATARSASSINSSRSS